MGSTNTKLAIDGGAPAKTTPNIPMYPGGYEIGEAEKREVCEALDKKYIFRYYTPDGQPSKVDQFERCMADMAGTKHALATNSCTSALISALVACGVGPGHEVIVPAFTYWSSASAVLCARAVPVIIPTRPNTKMIAVSNQREFRQRTSIVYH